MMQREIPGILIDIDVDCRICPRCGQKYQDLRTELTFAEVFQMLWVESPDPKNWKYKRRGSVLRLWHKIKIQIWADHLFLCESTAIYKELHEAQ